MEFVYEFNAGSLRRRAWKAIRKRSQWGLTDVAYGIIGSENCDTNDTFAIENNRGF